MNTKLTAEVIFRDAQANIEAILKHVPRDQRGTTMTFDISGISEEEYWKLDSATKRIELPAGKYSLERFPRSILTFHFSRTT